MQQSAEEDIAMMHRMKHRFAAFGLALILLLLPGCQAGGGGTLVLPDGSGTVPGVPTTWQEQLTGELNKIWTSGQKFQYYQTDDADAEKVLKTMQNGSAAEAEATLAENTEGYATGYVALQNQLKLSEEEKNKPRLVSYAIVTEGKTTAELAKDIMQRRCFVTKGPGETQTETGRVGFAKGEIGGQTFIIALFQ